MWKQIPEFPDYYASTEGTIKGPSGKVLKVKLMPKGYERVTVYRDKRPYYKEVHGLVLSAFSGPNPGGMQCRHLNGKPADNRPSNLKWGTGSENNLDQVLHGTHPESSRITCINGHKFDGFDYRRNIRTCSTCVSAHRKKYRQRHREKVK